ncbi:MAG: VWA domain-containing protein, partial [Chloroflexota bacterium]
MITNLARRGRGWRRAMALAATGVLVGSILLVGGSVLTASAASPITTSDLNPTASNPTSGGWLTPGNVWNADLNDYATTTADNRDQGYSGYALPAVPAGSIVTGIRVTAVAKVTDKDCDLGMSVSWDGGTHFTTRQDAGFTSANTDTSIAIGGVPGSSGYDTNTFGRVWSPSELTASNFRVLVRSVDTGSSCSSGTTWSLKSIKVDVTYRPGTAGTGNTRITPGAVCGQADFNFVVDTSGSIGDANLTTIKAQLKGFADTYQAGGDGIYSLSQFAASSSTRTSGYVSAASFKTAVDGLPGSNGGTWTQAGIQTSAANNAGDRAGVPNIMFVVTDGSPNKDSAADPTYDDPKTWQDGADAAILAANAARGSYYIYAVFVGTGDTNLPFPSPYDGEYAAYVMTHIGGGSWSGLTDFGNIAATLLDQLGCRQVTVTKVTDAHPASSTFTGSLSNATGNNVPAAWSATAPASASTTRVSTVVNVGKSRAHIVTEGTLPSGWVLKGFAGPIAATASCSTNPADYSSDHVDIPSGTTAQQVCVFNAWTDITVVKTNNQASPIAKGTDVTYTVTLTVADGPSGAVTVTDVLPVGLADPTAITDGGTWNSGTRTITWSLNSLPNGNKVLTYHAVVADQAAPGNLVNTATIVGCQGTGCSSTSTVTVKTPTVSIDKTNDKSTGTVVAGDTIHYTLTLAVSYGPALNVAVTDLVPGGITPGTISDGGAFNSITRVITWPTLASVTNGKQLTYAATVDATATAGEKVNTATITGCVSPIGAAPVTCTDTSTVTVRVPSISIDKTNDKTAPISRGTAVGYSLALTVTNGPTGAVTVTDLLPLGLNAPTAISDGGTYDSANQTITWAVASVPTGTKTLTYTALVADDATPGDKVNTATITTGPCGQACSDTSTITVLAPTVSIDKTNDKTAPVLRGESVAYTLTLTVADGPATNVTVTDVLPAGLDTPTAISDSGSYDAGSRTITWTLASVPTGTKTLTYSAAVSADASAGDLVNTASIAGCVAGVTAASIESAAPVLGAGPVCSDTSTVTVRVPSISIDKSNDTTAPVSKGTTVHYTLTLTVTDGPLAAATVQDVLPAGLDTPSNILPAGGAYNGLTRTITWDLVDVPTGDTTLGYDAVVSDDAPSGTLMNTAQITDGPCAQVCSSSSTVTVIGPTISIDKTNDKTAPVLRGESVAYTLT